MRDAAAVLLESMGYTVSLVENGRQAVDWCREFSFDVVLMDIQMPLMTGDEACRKISSEELCQCVILMSGQSHTDQQIAEYGAVGFIEKPITIDQITAHIDACLQRVPN